MFDCGKALVVMTESQLMDKGMTGDNDKRTIHRQSAMGGGPSTCSQEGSPDSLVMEATKKPHYRESHSKHRKNI
jgi:hypothetical protein